MPRNGRYQIHDLVLNRRSFISATYFRTHLPLNRCQLPGRGGWDLETYRRVVRYFDGQLQSSYVRSILPESRESRYSASALWPSTLVTPTVLGAITTVGADPEFEVLNSEGAVVRAIDYIKGGTRSSVGIDGAAHTGELRPEFGTPETCFNSIKMLLTQLSAELPSNFQIRAGGGVVHPLGGHIHIGGHGQTPSAALLHALDRFITIPLNLHVHPTRSHSLYNRLSSARVQPHGWEYRSPPSWLSHPDITMGALSIAYVLSQQTDEALATLSTKEKLLEIMGDYQQAAEKFFNFLDASNQLEDIVVFRAWGIKE